MMMLLNNKWMILIYKNVGDLTQDSVENMFVAGIILNIKR